jgi:ATP-dependent exoDNAse (exonuclease V) beta subunit
VQVAYAHASLPDLWELRPKRFADFVREEVRVTDPSGSQVRVMTVHKAKGLEFDVVVFPIPQRSSSWSGSIPAIVTGRETPTSPINFVTRYHGKKIRKLLSKEVQQLFEEELQRDIREAMCVLYVALTRAAHATHVIVTSNAKPDHKSAAGLLIATVCPDSTATEGLLYEAGDPNWHQRKSESEASSDDQLNSPTKPPGQFELAQFYLPADAALVHRPLVVRARSGRGSLHESPSHLAGGDETTINALMPTMSGQHLEQRELLRCCFDLVQWLDQHVPTAEQLEIYLREQHPSSDPKPAIAQFLEVIKQDSIRKLLSLNAYQSLHLAQFSPADSLGLEASRLEVQTARRFSMSTPSGMLDGVIDRLVLIYEGDRLIGADVIDLKTERLDSSLLQTKIAFYAPQFEAYRRAVADFTGLPLAKIAVRVVFLQAAQVVNYSVVEVSVDEQAPPRRSNAKKTPPEIDEISNPRSEPAAEMRPRPKKPNIKNRPGRGSLDRQRRFWDE